MHEATLNPTVTSEAAAELRAAALRAQAFAGEPFLRDDEDAAAMLAPGTARRMIRRGELRNRIVARPGGFAYLVYLPNSWHAQFAAHAHRAVAESQNRPYTDLAELMQRGEAAPMSRRSS